METLAELYMKIKKGKATRDNLADAINLRCNAMRKPMLCPVCGVDRCNDLSHDEVKV